MAMNSRPYLSFVMLLWFIFQSVVTVGHLDNGFCFEKDNGAKDMVFFSGDAQPDVQKQNPESSAVIVSSAVPVETETDTGTHAAPTCSKEGACRISVVALRKLIHASKEQDECRTKLSYRESTLQQCESTLQQCHSHKEIVETHLADCHAERSQQVHACLLLVAAMKAINDTPHKATYMTKGAMCNMVEQRIVAGTHVLLDALSALSGSFGAMWNMAKQRIVAGTHVLLDALSAVSSSFGAMWNTAEQRIVAGTHVLLDPLSALLGSFGAMWNMAEQRIVAGTHVLLDALSALSSWIDDRVEVFAPIILLVVLMSVLAVIILVLCCTVSTFRWERVVNNLHVETASWVGDDVASM